MCANVRIWTGEVDRGGWATIFGVVDNGITCDDIVSQSVYMRDSGGGGGDTAHDTTNRLAPGKPLYGRTVHALAPDIIDN